MRVGLVGFGPSCWGTPPGSPVLVAWQGSSCGDRSHSFSRPPPMGRELLVPLVTAQGESMEPGVSLLDRLGRPPDRPGRSPAPCACTQRTKVRWFALGIVRRDLQKVSKIFQAADRRTSIAGLKNLESTFEGTSPPGPARARGSPVATRSPEVLGGGPPA